MMPSLSLYSDRSSWCDNGGPDWFWNTVTGFASVAVLAMCWWIISRAQSEATPVHRSKSGLAVSALVVVAVSIYALVWGATSWRLIFFGGIAVSGFVLKIVQNRHVAAADGGTVSAGWLVADRVLVWTAPKLTLAAATVAIAVLASAVLFGPSCPGPT